MLCGGRPCTILSPEQPLGSVHFGTGQSHAEEQASSFVPASFCGAAAVIYTGGELRI